jgi:hypothetical protein
MRAGCGDRSGGWKRPTRAVCPGSALGQEAPRRWPDARAARVLETPPPWSGACGGWLWNRGRQRKSAFTRPSVVVIRIQYTILKHSVRREGCQGRRHAGSSSLRGKEVGVGYRLWCMIRVRSAETTP